MLAARIIAAHDLRVGEVRDPSPGPGEALVRVRAAGICATDLELYHGDHTYYRTGMASFPIIPGHEWSGEVLALGAGATGVSVGDRVVGECGTGCMACAVCSRGRHHLCPNRRETGILGRDGAFAELLVMQTLFLHRIDPRMSFEEAALVEPSAVAANAVGRAGVGPRDSVAVFGAGTIGLLAAQIARHHGARLVILLDTREERLALGRTLGFEHTLDARRPDLQLQVEGLVGQGGCDVAIDATGSTRALEQAIEVAAPAGRICAAGMCGGRRVSLDLDRLVTRDIAVVGSLGSPHMWPSTIALLSDGRLRAAPLISHRFSLASVRDAFDLVESGAPEVVKVLLQP